MSQNPFDQQNQQDNPFGSPQGQQESPFGQPQSGFGQFQSAGPSGFNQPFEPERKRGGAGRTCLLVFIAVFACCALCVGGAFAGALYYRPIVPAIFWAAIVQSDGADQTGNIVCEGSQAERFSATFTLRYANVTSFDFTNDISVDRDNNTVEMHGSFVNEGDTVPFDATFHIDTDNGVDALRWFGCVDRIEPDADSPLPAVQ